MSKEHIEISLDTCAILHHREKLSKLALQNPRIHFFVSTVVIGEVFDNPTDEFHEFAAAVGNDLRPSCNRKFKQIGIKIEKFKSAVKTGYRKLYSSRYQREDVRALDDSRHGRDLSEFQHFILDCYISRQGRKGDTLLHGFRTERGQEVAIFVGPNSGETTRSFVVECLESVGRRAKSIQKVEILGWSFSPSLIRSLERLSEDHDIAIELKKIHVFALRIEDALRSRNVRFIPAARATIEVTRSSASLNCELRLNSPISEIRDVHWFIYSEASTDLEKIEYNFINDETLEAAESESLFGIIESRCSQAAHHHSDRREVYERLSR